MNELLCLFPVSALGECVFVSFLVVCGLLHLALVLTVLVRQHMLVYKGKNNG